MASRWIFLRRDILWFSQFLLAKLLVTILSYVYFSRVVSRCYQQFFGIGILPVSDLTGRSVFRSVLLVLRELLFSAKGGLAVSKRGPVPPFSLQKGASAPFLREKGVPAKKMIPKCTDQDFFQYWYGKYKEILTDTNRKIPIRYTTLCFLNLKGLSPSWLLTRDRTGFKKHRGLRNTH
jgi:hypothetical protein